MNRSYDHYALLADLFCYPDEAARSRVQNVQDYLNENYSAAAAQLEPFSSFVAEASEVQLEELYLRTFNVQAITTLDIGYVLFGDDYKRGAVLVHLNKEHTDVGNPCHNELPDHLPNVLRLLPLLEDADFREELIDRLVAPAVAKIISEFAIDNIKKKERVYMKHHKTLIDAPTADGTLYRYPLMALFTVMQTDYHLSEEKVAETSSSFLTGIGAEIRLEAEDV